MSVILMKTPKSLDITRDCSLVTLGNQPGPISEGISIMIWKVPRVTRIAMIAKSRMLVGSDLESNWGHRDDYEQNLELVNWDDNKIRVKILMLNISWELWLLITAPKIKIF